MELSPSDIFKKALSGKSVSLENYLSVRSHRVPNKVCVMFKINQDKPTFKSKSLVVDNPLAMMQAIAVLRKELHHLLAEETRLLLEQEQIRATQQFLEGQRLEIARKHREKLAAEQQRIENVVKYVSEPIQAILQRVTPVIDPWAYRNVYGKPAEVFIF